MAEATQQFHEALTPPDGELGIAKRAGIDLLTKLNGETAEATDAQIVDNLSALEKATMLDAANMDGDTEGASIHHLDFTDENEEKNGSGISISSNVDLSTGDFHLSLGATLEGDEKNNTKSGHTVFAKNKEGVWSLDREADGTSVPVSELPGSEKILIGAAVRVTADLLSQDRPDLFDASKETPRIDQVGALPPEQDYTQIPEDQLD